MPSYHTSTQTIRLLGDQKIELTGHPPYSFDLHTARGGAGAGGGNAERLDKRNISCILGGWNTRRSGNRALPPCAAPKQEKKRTQHRLKERYASPSMIYATASRKLFKTPWRSLNLSGLNLILRVTASLAPHVHRALEFLTLSARWHDVTSQTRTLNAKCALARRDLRLELLTLSARWHDVTSQTRTLNAKCALARRDLTD
ncbi:hypothetical protein EVAR_98223_1 [Eumeta japonica]|uniref:Uncharacterized protein n=1 Tax=Eumeta variegata TaxID=151549 RepID=A0A4C1Y5M6_EUMVA|nr:hypothetical protein EVAR_98223_1 [Eumeta japonica]